MRSLCPFMSHHALLCETSVLVCVSPSCDSCSWSESWQRAWLKSDENWSPVQRGAGSGCSGCSLVWVACKNRQAAVNQLTANTDLRCDHGFSLRRASRKLPSSQCLIFAVLCGWGMHRSNRSDESSYIVASGDCVAPEWILNRCHFILILIRLALYF